MCVCVCVLYSITQIPASHGDPQVVPCSPKLKPRLKASSLIFQSFLGLRFARIVAVRAFRSEVSLVF